MANGSRNRNSRNPLQTAEIEENTAQLISNTVALQALTGAISRQAGGDSPTRQVMEVQRRERQEQRGEERPQSINDLLRRQVRESQSVNQRRPQSNNDPNIGTRIASSITGSISGSITGVIGLLSAKLIAVLAPVALLASAIGAKTSGASAFLDTIQLMGTVLAGLLMPAFIFMGGIVFAAAMALQAYLLPRLKEYYTTVLEGLINATNRLTQAFNVASKIFEGQGNLPETGVGGAVNSVLNEFGDTFSAWGKLLDDTSKAEKGQQRERDEIKRLEEYTRRLQEGNALGGVMGGVTAGMAPKTPEEILKEGRKKDEAERNKPSTFMDNFFRGMDIMLRTIEQNVNPQATRTGLVDAYKQAQMAALNTRPIEAEMRKIMLEQLTEMRKAVEEIRKLHIPEPTTH